MEHATTGPAPSATSTARAICVILPGNASAAQLSVLEGLAATWGGELKTCDEPCC